MKIGLNKNPAGVVLIVALFVIVGAGVVLASYLTLMQNETRSVARSQIWNQCVPVMEAGVEEAMAHVQYCGYTTNLALNNWKLYADGYYHKTRSVGTNGSYCDILILPVLPPVIYSTAYVPIPDTATNYLSRKVRVYTTNGFGSGGLVAKGAISLSGNVQVDSYNSLIAPYNASSPGTNAIAKTDSTAAGAVTVAGSSKIYGMAVTGPGGSIVTSGTSTVGDASYNTRSSAGVESGWSANDANFQVNDVGTPNTATNWTSISVASLTGGLIGTNLTNYTYLLTTGNYYLTGDWTMNGIQTLGISGAVKLYVTGAFAVTRSAYVYIAPNSSLTLYSGGSVNIAGNGMYNASGSTSAVTVYGTTTCTNVTIANGSALVGSVYAPEAAISVTGAGGFYGALTGNTITIANSGGVHYDQALSGSQYFTAAAWNEL